MLNRKELLAVEPKSQVVETSVGEIRVRCMTVGERIEFEAEAFKDNEDSNPSFGPLLLTYCLIDEDGDSLLDNLDEALVLPADVCKQLIPVAMDLCGMSLKSKEDIEKN